MVKSKSEAGRRPGADPVGRDMQKKGGVSVCTGSGRCDSVVHSRGKLGEGQGRKDHEGADSGMEARVQGGKSSDRRETETGRDREGALSHCPRPVYWDVYFSVVNHNRAISSNKLLHLCTLPHLHILFL